MTIYRFKVYNSIGNTYTIGRMAGSKQQVEDHCKKAIKEANVNSPGKWEYDIELMEIHKTKRKLLNNNI